MDQNMIFFQEQETGESLKSNTRLGNLKFSTVLFFGSLMVIVTVCLALTLTLGKARSKKKSIVNKKKFSRGPKCLKVSDLDF
jgi:hypothetical protein